MKFQGKEPITRSSLTPTVLLLTISKPSGVHLSHSMYLIEVINDEQLELKLSADDISCFIAVLL